MLKRILGISALLLFCVGGWQLGASLSSQGFSLAMGILYGSLFGVPVLLIAATAKRTVHHEHTHRVVVETPVAPTVRPTVAIAQRPQRLIVIDERNKLAASINKRLEVR